MMSESVARRLAVHCEFPNLMPLYAVSPKMIGRVQRASAHFENFNHCLLPKPALFAFGEKVKEYRTWGNSIELLVSLLQTRHKCKSYNTVLEDLMCIVERL